MTSPDEGLNQAGLLARLRAACREAGSQRAWARGKGFSDAYVSDVLGGRREVSEAMANALGFWRRVTFHKIAKEVGDAEG